VASFKVSNDPFFADKLEAIVGLYLNPPEHALVLSVDEKSQIQALDRTQPGLPIKKGRGATMTHDYKRNGTTTLFAALNVASGEVYGLCQQKHRHQEWLRFLRMIDQTVPAGKEIYLICDNYSTHKHERVQRWLASTNRPIASKLSFSWSSMRMFTTQHDPPLQAHLVLESDPAFRLFLYWIRVPVDGSLSPRYSKCIILSMASPAL
jgi:transposase